jgi:sulfite oxidase
LPPDGKPGPGAGIPLGLVALNSDVLSPAAGETVAAGSVEVRGYAFAGGERHVARVDVSIDGGASWSQAELLEDLGPWAWRQWRMTVHLAPGEHEILVRAWDSSAATQPEENATLWNPKGYVNNARPHVLVRAAAA